MPEITVSFYSQNQRIIGSISGPLVRGKQTFPAALILHGYTAYRNEGFDLLADALAEAGFIALRIDLRGSGQSGGQRGNILPTPDWLEDARNGLTFLEAWPGVDPARLGVIGVSLGGGTALELAATDARLRGTVALAPVGDGRDFLRSNWRLYQAEAAWQKFLTEIKQEQRRRLIYGTEGYRPVWEVLGWDDPELIDYFIESRDADPLLTRDVSLSSVDSILRFKPARLCHLIQSPTLFAHDPQDPIVPFSHSQQMSELVGGPKHLLPVPGGEHNLILGPEKEKIMAATIGWFQCHLKEGNNFQ